MYALSSASKNFNWSLNSEERKEIDVPPERLGCVREKTSERLLACTSERGVQRARPCVDPSESVKNMSVDILKRDEAGEARGEAVL
jgi:hypothetical protein